MYFYEFMHHIQYVFKSCFFNFNKYYFHISTKFIQRLLIFEIQMQFLLMYFKQHGFHVDFQQICLCHFIANIL